MAVTNICQDSNEGKTAGVHTMSQNCKESRFMFSNSINFWCKSHINVTAEPSIVLIAKGTWGP